VHPWVLRVAWAAVPLVAGPALAAALNGRTAAARTVATIGLWAGWAVVLAGTLVPHPIGLTALRVAAPGAVVTAAAAAASGQASAAAGLAAVAVTLASAFVAFLPATGMLFVNGPAYPNERRFPLRPPGALLAGLLALAWAMAVGPPVAGALAIAGGQWVLGGILLGLGAPVSWVLARALHGLSRRWLVFVPAGVVLHDPLTLADPVLFRRQVIAALRAARAGSDSLDLTGGAPGLALELVLTEKVPMVLVTPGNRQGEPGASARLLFTPTRPGAVLAEAAARRLPR